MSNLILAEKVLRACAEAGVTEYCLCAGARNSPLVFLLAKAQGIRLYSFFDERSAAFFALGRIKRSQQPVAVVTTSGTAVAELLPAAVEGTYAGLPLLLLTADRPRSYRGSGAPQTIEQVGIFSKYVETCWDIESVEEDLRVQDWSQKMPLQINVCFDEPLIEGDINTLNLAFQDNSHPRKILSIGSSHVRKIKNPLIIVGALKKHEVPLVVDFLKTHQAPIFAESISQLRGHPDLQGRLIAHGDSLIPKLFESGRCETVIRLGGVPTLRFWRDLEENFKKVPVYSCSNEEWVGLSRSVRHAVGFEFLKVFEVVEGGCPLFPKDVGKVGSHLLREFPRSEVSLLSQLSEKIQGRSLYLGNSLPIREWDLVSSLTEPCGEVEANRGANGIDGQISTYLGWSEEADESEEFWAVIGDLTAMYDLSALWITPNLKKGRRRIVVINNQGGQIFKNIFAEPAFLNRHSLNFKNWAEQWGWNYKLWTEIPDSVDFSEENMVIELKPDEASSDQFWREYKKL